MAIGAGVGGFLFVAIAVIVTIVILRFDIKDREIVKIFMNTLHVHTCICVEIKGHNVFFIMWKIINVLFKVYLHQNFSLLHLELFVNSWTFRQGNVHAMIIYCRYRRQKHSNSSTSSITYKTGRMTSSGNFRGTNRSIVYVTPIVFVYTTSNTVAA